jgi:hypothetical protein
MLASAIKQLRGVDISLKVNVMTNLRVYTCLYVCCVCVSPLVGCCLGAFVRSYPCFAVLTCGIGADTNDFITSGYVDRKLYDENPMTFVKELDARCTGFLIVMNNICSASVAFTSLTIRV